MTCELIVHGIMSDKHLQSCELSVAQMQVGYSSHEFHHEVEAELKIYKRDSSRA